MPNVQFILSACGCGLKRVMYTTYCCTHAYASSVQFENYSEQNYDLMQKFAPTIISCYTVYIQIAIAYLGASMVEDGKAK